MTFTEIAQSIIDSMKTPMLDGFRTPEKLGELVDSDRWVALSSGERIMVGLARCIWNGSSFDLSEALGRLDDEHFARVIIALMQARPKAGAIVVESEFPDA